jgi:hypothetical protein
MNNYLHICVKCHNALITQSIIGLAEKEKISPEQHILRYCGIDRNFHKVDSTCKNFKAKSFT